MKIMLFLDDRILYFFLPNIVEGSFSFDFNIDEEFKLINVQEKKVRQYLEFIHLLRIIIKKDKFMLINLFFFENLL